MSSTVSNNLYLAKFTNGTLLTDAGQDVTFGAFKGKTNKAKTGETKQMLVAEAGEHTYVGQNFGDLKLHSSDRCKFLLGVRNKKTGKMRIHDVSILQMKPYFEGDGNDDVDSDSKPAEKSFNERTDDLTAAFGSNKRKQAMSKRHKNRLTDARLKDAVDTAVDRTLGSADIDTLLATKPKGAEMSDIPKHDVTATTLQDAYPLNDIVGQQVHDALKSCVEPFMQSNKAKIEEWTKNSTYPNVVLHFLKYLPIKESDRQHRACLLLYLHYMLHLYALKHAELKKMRNNLFPDMNVPQVVVKSLLSRFTLKLDGYQTRSIPSRLKDKLTCYILVLCLHLEDFKFEIDHILQDLQLSKKRLVNFCQILGCKVTHSKNAGGVVGDFTTSTATLTLPLTFPEVRTKKEKRR